MDSGSTHNFISATAAQRLGLTIHPQAGINVSVANETKLSSSRICPTVFFSVNQHNFIAEFFVIPLAGFDLVLGVKWLRTLRPILWNFTSLTELHNQRQDHFSAWTADTSSSSDSLPTKILSRLAC